MLEYLRDDVPFLLQFTNGTYTTHAVRATLRFTCTRASLGSIDPYSFPLPIVTLKESCDITKPYALLTDGTVQRLRWNHKRNWELDSWTTEWSWEITNGMRSFRMANLCHVPDSPTHWDWLDNEGY